MAASRTTEPRRTELDAVDAEDLPGTLRRSSAKAQRTYAKTLAHAHEEYPGDEARAHRAAFASLKHSFEKVGDRWVAKRHRGPSDERAAQGGPDPTGRSAGGVDVLGHTRAELLERARSLGVKGRWSMTKQQLGEAIARAQDRPTPRSDLRSMRR